MQGRDIDDKVRRIVAVIEEVEPAWRHLVLEAPGLVYCPYCHLKIEGEKHPMSVCPATAEE